MAKAYLIAHIRVHDKEKFAEFAAMAGPSIAQYGGRVLAKGPHADHREGDLRGVVMLIEFDNMEAAKTFWAAEDYHQDYIAKTGRACHVNIPGALKAIGRDPADLSIAGH